MPRFAPDLLARWAEAVLAELGVPPEEARIVADVLVQADLRGVHSHGMTRLPDYARRIRLGTWRPGVPLAVVAEHGGLCLADAQNGIGPVMAFRAMQRAVDRAERFGIAAVLVRRAGHLGRAGHYAEMAARRRMVGLVISNATPSMSPWGGKGSVLGNNPWAIAVPRRDGPAIVLDMALSVAARGKIQLARERGERIPLGWALDEQGRPTDDPEAALRGTLLPIGGHKGYGMALMFDLLAGALSGSGVGTEVRHPLEHHREENVGQLFLALNIASVRPLELVLHDVEKLVAMVKAASAGPGQGEVLLPGERAARHAARQADGIELPDAVVRRLERFGEELGLALPAPGQQPG